MESEETTAVGIERNANKDEVVGLEYQNRTKFAVAPTKLH